MAQNRRRELRRLQPVPALGLLLALAIAAGCNTGPARVHQPGIDANRAGRLAIEQYDTNGDGVISGDELDRAPAIKAALARLDTNGDGAVSAEEIAARVRVWQGTRIGVLPISLTVTLNGRPLDGATVTFEPEVFLGDQIKPATCPTDVYGGGGPSIPKELRPDPERTPPGVHVGLYQVKISKIVNGKETIPARYNEQTILGQEVAPDVPELGSLRVVFALSTR